MANMKKTVFWGKQTVGKTVTKSEEVEGREPWMPGMPRTDLPQRPIRPFPWHL